MKKIILAFLVLISPLASALPLDEGKIRGYIPYVQGGVEYLFIQLDHTREDRLDCNGTNRYVITSNSGNYRATLSAVMAAFHAQSPVKVVRLGHCDDYNNSESMAHLCVGDIPC